jgi:ABC-type glutathione transport system ATPase component
MTTAAPTSTHAARAVELTKVYGTGEAAVRALDSVTVEFEHARFTAVMGPSGSGKSTLMHCMAGLDAASSGRTYIGERELGELNDAGLTELRRVGRGERIVGDIRRRQPRSTARSETSTRGSRRNPRRSRTRSGPS